MNLILGEELLPYSVLSTTSTICELKYGKQCRIVAHFKDKDSKTGQSTKTFHLFKPPEGSSEQSYLQQISPFVHVKSDREKGSIYKKIEIFWPHQLLEVVIIYLYDYYNAMKMKKKSSPTTKSIHHVHNSYDILMNQKILEPVFSNYKYCLGHGPSTNVEPHMGRT